MQAARQTILVVSPKSDQTRMICQSLERAGYLVLVTEQGHEALELLHEFSPDLALFDWKLPDLNSLALIRTIRSEEWLANLPIILRGTEMKEDDFILGLEAGADLCLKEPFQAEVFVARVRALLRRCDL